MVATVKPAKHNNAAECGVENFMSEIHGMSFHCSGWAMVPTIKKAIIRIIVMMTIIRSIIYGEQFRFWLHLGASYIALAPRIWYSGVVRRIENNFSTGSNYTGLRYRSIWRSYARRYNRTEG